MKSVDLITQAMERTRRLHFHQFRKVVPVPYYLHPFNVFRILAEYHQEDYLLAAALLHDTLEDCNYSFDELKREFSGKIACLVYAVSEKQKIVKNIEQTEKGLPLSWEFFRLNDQFQSLSSKEQEWLKRKEFFLRDLNSCQDIDVFKLLLADKIDNLESMRRLIQVLHHDFWLKLNAGKKLQQAYYFSIQQIVLSRIQKWKSDLCYCSLVNEFRILVELIFRK